MTEERIAMFGPYGGPYSNLYPSA